MRWRVTIKPYTGPREGDIRYRRRYAFFPVMIDDYWYWLEPYYAVQQYDYSTHDGGGWWEFRGRISPREYARRRQCELVAR